MKKFVLLLMALPVLLLLTACEKETYTVTFVDHNGEVIYEVIPDGDVVPPEDPLREGYVFDGWYTDEEYLDLYDEYDFGDVLTSDLTIYVKWAPAVYTVTVHYGPGIEPQEIQYTFGEEITIDNPATKKGYTVGEVYINEANTVEFDPAFAPTNDFDVYVSWIPKTVTINYYENVPFEVGFFSISESNTHIVTTYGEVFVWGTNSNRMFGTSSILENVEHMVPVNITAEFGFEENEMIVQMSKDEHVLALTNQNRVFGWGKSEAFQLGFAQGALVPSPLDLTSDLPLSENDYVVSVSAGYRHSVFLTNEGRLIVTGDGDYGQLGYEQISVPTSFVDVTDLVGLLENETIVEAYAYDESTLLYTSQERVLVAGHNGLGQLGTGDFNHKYSFTDITTFFNLEVDEEIVDFQFGERYVLVLTNTGKLYSFGKNTEGQLGLGHFNNTNVPTLVVDSGVEEIFAKGYNAAYIDEQGSLYLWGLIVSELNWFEGSSELRNTPEILMQSMFNDGSPFSDFNLGYGLFWFFEGDFYIGEGSTAFGQLLGPYPGTNLHENFADGNFVLVHTEEATYGEFYEPYFPDKFIDSELTKWFTEEEMIHRFFGNANLTYEELDLYGVWETRFYMVTIYQNNETQGYVRPMEYGEQLFFYAEKSGYILEGWYLDEELTIPFEFEVMPDYDVTIYAKWTEVVPEQLTVPFDGVLSSVNEEGLYEFTISQAQHFLMYGEFNYRLHISLLDGDRNPIDDIENLYFQSVLMGDEVLFFSEMLLPGTYYIHVFEESYSSSSGYSFDARIALLDYFIPEYQSLELNYGEVHSTENFSILSGTILNLEVYFEIMFHFEGWYLDSEFTTPFELEFMPNESLVLYAKYEAQEIRELTFDTEEYTGNISQNESIFYTFTFTDTATFTTFSISDMDTYAILYDEDMNYIKSNDDYQGLDFRISMTLLAGTYYLEVRGLSGSEQGPYILIFTDGTYQAPTYTLTIETNGGTALDPVELEFGDFFELEPTTKDGFLFGGFYLDAALTIPLDNYTMPNHDLTIYIKWIVPTPIDLVDSPIARSGSLVANEIVAYGLTLTDTTTFTVEATGAGDLFFVVVNEDLEGTDYFEFGNEGTGSILVTLEPGEYFIVVVNQSHKFGGTFEIIVTET